MAFMTEIFLASILVFWAIYYFSSKRQKLRKIPGPKGYPIVGNALQMDLKQPHKTLLAWAKQYGDVMRINLFGDDIIVANSFEAMKEMFITKSNEFAGRESNYRCNMVFGDHDLSFRDLEYPKWSFMKKAAMKGLKQVGDQVTDLETILIGYLDGLIDVFQQSEGKAVDVRRVVHAFVNHVTFTLVYGRELPANEREELVAVHNGLNYILNPMGEHASLDALPFLRGFWSAKYRELTTLVKRSKEFHQSQTNSTINRYEGEIRCALDILIKEMKQPSVHIVDPINMENTTAVGMEMLGAGVLTTSSALYYLISLVASNPVLQEEAYQHIVTAIGHRQPSLQDRFSVPFIESMILEMLRLMSHLPVGLPHKTLKDTTLQGYEIPHGVQVWSNLWFLHHDERLWEDPWEFKPKRFLNDDGNLVKADHPLRKQMYPFGAGRRVCIGESLAKHRMFLFMVSLLQKFRFTNPEGKKIVTDPRHFNLGFVLSPLDYEVRIEART